MLTFFDLYSWALTTFLFGITGFVYSLNSLGDKEEDKINSPGKHDIFKRYGRIIVGSYMLTALVSLLFLASNLYFSISVLAVFLIGIIYTFPLFPWFSSGQIKFYRLKEIFFFKNFMTSVTYVFYTFLLPFVYFEKSPEFSLWMIIGIFLMLTMVSAIICDIRDITGDQEVGIQTIPTQLGRKKSMILCYGMILAPLFISFVIRSINLLSANSFAIILVICLIQLAVLIYDHIFRFKREFHGFASEVYIYVSAFSLVFYF